MYTYIAYCVLWCPPFNTNRYNWLNITTLAKSSHACHGTMAGTLPFV